MIDSGAEIPQPKDTKAAFLTNHERELTDFLTVVHGQVDHATADRKNDGQLWQPGDARNAFGSEWQGTFPELPSHVTEFSDFSKGEPVKIESRYNYGSNGAQIWIGATNEDKSKQFYVNFSVDPQTGAVTNNPWDRHKAGGEYDQTEIGEADVRRIMDDIFSGNEAYEKGKDQLSVGDAFKLGVTTQPDYGAESYAVDYGLKGVGFGGAQGQLNLEVRVVNGSHPQGKPSTTSIQLKKAFTPEDYPDGIFGGNLQQELRIEQDADGKIIDAERKSSFYLADEPLIVDVNGQERVGAILNKAEGDLPEVLASKLYPTPVPDVEDLRYFEHIITQPIHEEDLHI